ncbi:cupin domain-containing protein [Fibrivirga algicola]|uniref:Cupin domain-containing protein n=1 Tax=Fibrivirga algicola TaxID=2950420 RepID=A0ABX0QPF1_9BACT|nr:cupin domain-containing protein [Fibrivirga algicola]ARK11482.1 cupin [Fibrella sp. ES10-3-2-2]NID12658.1 cupin domain-containing protein [Fibrivirga algicola]
MKRRHFLEVSLAITPLVGTAHQQPIADHDQKGFKVKAGEGRYHGHIQLKGVNANIQDVKISGKDTNGGLAIFEQTSLSPKRGTPLHIHPLQDEIFQVLDGEYLFQVGQDKYQLTTGDSIFLPRNIAHAWTQISPKGRMTVIVQPAGKLEEFFVLMSKLDKEPTEAEMVRHFADHEMKIVGPPLKVD